MLVWRTLLARMNSGKSVRTSAQWYVRYIVALADSGNHWHKRDIEGGGSVVEGDE